MEREPKQGLALALNNLINIYVYFNACTVTVVVCCVCDIRNYSINCAHDGIEIYIVALIAHV